MMWNLYLSKDYWQTTVSDLIINDLLLNRTEVIEQATETVNDVIAVMPQDLSPDEEKVFLTNSGHVLSMAAVIIKEMIAAKKPAVLN